MTKMKKSKSPRNLVCKKCLSHDILKLKSGLFTCLNCGDKWKSGAQKPSWEMSLEGEVVAYIHEKQESGIDLLDVQNYYITQKRKRREKREARDESKRET